MEQEPTPMVRPKNTEVLSERSLSAMHTVTPLSKYLAMALFITLPFIGGWIGYTYAPEKIVEVEKVVMVETESTIQTPDMVDAPLPVTPAPTSTAVVEEEFVHEDGLRRIVEADSEGNVTVTETYAPTLFPLNQSIFAKDRSSTAVCLNELDEITITIPAEVNNLLLKPVGDLRGRISLLLESDNSTIGLEKFDVYAVEENESAMYTHRWIYGDVENEYFDFVPNELHRYQVSFEFPNRRERENGEGRGFSSFSVKTEPFVVRDCGIEI